MKTLKLTGVFALMVALSACAGGSGGGSAPAAAPVAPVGPVAQSVSVSFDCINQVCFYRDLHAGGVSKIYAFGTSAGMGLNVPINGTAELFVEFAAGAQGSTQPQIALYSDTICVGAEVYSGLIVTERTDGTPYTTTNPYSDAAYCWINSATPSFNVPRGDIPVAYPLGSTLQGWTNTFTEAPEFSFFSTPTIGGAASVTGPISLVDGGPWGDTTNVSHWTETCSSLSNVVTCSYFVLDLN